MHRTDVPLSATRNTLPSGHATALPYVPPHPQRGTPYHRYTTLLLEQSSPSTPSAEIHRDGFDVRAYIEQNNLTVAGIHFWRGQWRPENAGTVSKVYEEILREYFALRIFPCSFTGCVIR